MPKPNARTFRYSDEVKNILEQYNNDFDGLVVEAFLRLPEVKKQVEYYEKRKEELLNQVTDLKRLDNSLSDLIFNAEHFARKFKDTALKFKEM